MESEWGPGDPELRDIEGGAPDPGGGRDRDSGERKEIRTAYQIALGRSLRSRKKRSSLWYSR